MANPQSFEFRMSKKVAELTQVVHMLFSRNHERELEIEALKDAYEYEIHLVVKDAKNRLSEKDSLVGQLQQQLTSQATSSVDTQNMEETLEKIADLEHQISFEKQNYAKLNMLHEQNQEQLHQMALQKEHEEKHFEQRLYSKNKEIEGLIVQIQSYEAKLSGSEKEESLRMGQLNAMTLSLKNENENLRKTLIESESKKDLYHQKLRQLEEERKNAQEKPQLVSKNIQTEPIENNTGKSMEDKIIELRKEVARLRNELKNREGNFNRVFSDQTPILLERSRSRTRQYSSKNFKSEEVLRAEELRGFMLSPVRPTSSARSTPPPLPQLSVSSSKTPMLEKPKPLPREFLKQRAASEQATRLST